MTSFQPIEIEADELQSSAWPRVYPFRAFPEGLNGFLLLPLQEQVQFLVTLRSDPERHGKFLQEGLACLYAYVLGYADSPIYLLTPDALERRLQAAKITLEREMLDHWLRPQAPPDLGDAQETALYLQELMRDNRGVSHPFFSFVRDRMSPESLLEFLRFEAVSHEAADDETAFTVVGLQGLMRKAIAANLCEPSRPGGLSLRLNGVRRLLSEIESEMDLKVQRESETPWFCKTISNAYRMLATRPGWKFRAYGAHLLQESWAGPHFQSILKGLTRNGHVHRDLAASAASQERIRRFRLEDMLAALIHQRPRLSSDELWEVSWGAHIAIASASKLYNQVLNHFQSGTS